MEQNEKNKNTTDTAARVNENVALESYTNSNFQTTEHTVVSYFYDLFHRLTFLRMTPCHTGTVSPLGCVPLDFSLSDKTTKQIPGQIT